MGNFAEQPPSNLGTPSTESDPVAQLFSAEYVFGAPTYNIEQSPGPSDVAAGPTMTEPPIDVTTPAEQTPTPAAMGGPTQGGTSNWIPWPSGNSTLLVSLGGKAVQSIWFPVVPFEVAVSPGSAPGSLLYTLTTQGGELVPIPGGQTQVALTALVAPDTTWSTVWVYVSTEAYAPFKAGSGAVVTPPTPYQQLVISDPTLVHFWPCTDAAGTTALTDLGPGNIPLLALNGVTLGASGFLPNGQTCAQSAGSSGGGLIPQSPIPSVDSGGNIKSVEFWVMPLTAGGAYLWGLQDPGEDHGFSVLTVLNVLQFYFNYFPYNSNTTMAEYGVHHIVTTKNGAIGDVYLDGALIQSVATDCYFFANSFGFLYDPNNDTMNTPAKICNVAMYTGVLSLAEVQAHYASGLSA